MKNVTTNTLAAINANGESPRWEIWVYPTGQPS